MLSTLLSSIQQNRFYIKSIWKIEKIIKIKSKIKKISEGKISGDRKRMECERK